MDHVSDKQKGVTESWKR